MKLYTYEHCPFCVRVKMILNLTNTVYEEVILLNDDEELPIKLCGKKQVPILEYDNKILVESLDIINFINSQNNILTSNIISNEVQNWFNNALYYTCLLSFPRLIKLNLPEFQTSSAINYFKNKKEASLNMTFEEALKQTETLIKTAQKHLSELPSILPNKEAISIDDIVIFPILKMLSCVKNLNLNEETNRYMNRLSKLCKINLYQKI